MIDKYFRRPVIWDYTLVLIILSLHIFLKYKCIIELPSNLDNGGIASDLSNISLTSAGFILTLLTVLITFKSGSNIGSENWKEAKNTFELFFASQLYFETVRHLKNCIKSLIVISIFGFTLKLIFDIDILLYYFNIGALIIIVLTLWRCLLILSKILKMQKRE